MQRIWAVLLLVGVLAAPVANAQGDSENYTEGGPEQQAAIAVIQNQIDALSRSDGAAAYSYAAPIIKQKFRSAEMFMTMVRQGYGILIDPAGVEYLDLRTMAGDLMQAVRVLGRDGVSKILIYQMQLQEDGIWKIAGVYMTEDRRPQV